MAKGQIQGCTGRKGQNWNLNLGLSDYRALLFGPLQPFQCIGEKKGRGEESKGKGTFLTTEITCLLAYIPISVY